MENTSDFLNNLCLYCVSNYEVMNSARIMSSFIYQCGRLLNLDIMAVEGILYVEINGYKRQYAHCFNTYKSNIIDASIYQYALIYKNVENKFPLYISEKLPIHIEYKISNEIKYMNQVKFSKHLLNKVINEAKAATNLKKERFSLMEDNKKENLFQLIR